VDRSDYEWARDKVLTEKLNERAPVIFSPVWETLKPVDLAEWVIADKLPVRVQVQLHKILWGEKPGV
ncbi:MAG: 7-carboxy-7-deazaguanine synthase QueE, partial [Deefgea sp.]